MKNSKNFLSIVIPAYNEEKTIGEVIAAIPEDLTLPYEVIVVDDGSEDKTSEIALKFGVIVIRHIINRGYGAAINTGFRAAKGNIIATIDADKQNEAKEISKLVQPILNGNADLVIGSRYLKGEEYRIPLITRLGEKFINGIIKLKYGLKITNPQSGFRAIKREILDLIGPVSEDKMAFTTELLFKSMSASKNVLEMPKSERSREYGKSKVNLIKDGFRILYIAIKRAIKK